MTKEAAQFAAILKGWGPSLQRAVAKANASRWPAGAPGSKGGQFAPAKGGGTAPYSTSKLSFQPGQLSLFSGLQEGIVAPQYGIKKPMMAGPSKWLEPGHPVEPKPAPPGAKPHLKTDDYGKPVTINYPTKPSGPETWKNPDATATFVPGGPAPASLNGVPLKPWVNPPKNINEWANVEGQRPELDADFTMEPAPGKSVGAGVIIQEPDGRLWLTKPTNHFGGYQQTFPKGTVENGLSLQASAIKEAYEETGLKVQITGVLGDYERTTSVARFYVARRVGGTPADMGWESQALRLATSRDLGKLLNMGVDKDILEDLRAEQFLKRAPLSLLHDREVIEEEVARRGLEWLYKAGAKPPGDKGGGKWEKQARWPAGSPLGGQWKAMGADGLTQPPAIAGGLSGANPAYQKKANAVHALAQTGNLKSVLDYAVSYEKTVQASVAAGKKSSHTKWHAQLSQYTTQLVADLTAKPKAEASAAKLSGPEKLVASYTKVGAKPGGSNDGAVYADASGTKWLVKGNNYAATGGLALSDDRAKNEVLASKLMSAAGIPGPEIKLVDLDGQHTGNLGVAVKWIDGLEKFNPNNATQLAAVQNQFAVHAWLGNWDVLGMGLDNTAFKDGQAINIDPGGSILFRAQGAPKAKGAFDAQASDWETMRSTDKHQQSVYGKMSQSQLQESAKQLAAVTDETIRKLVDAHGPGDADAKAELAGKLIARRNAILTKAGLQAEAMKLSGVEVKQAEPAPPPAPPKIVEAVPAPANTPAPANIEKPAFNSGLPSDPYYQGLADKALAMHQAGDLAGLKAMATKKNGDPAWPAKTKHGKTMSGWHGALVADLEGKQQAAAAQVSAGAATVTDAKGQAWQADNGVLNPVAAPAQRAAVIPKIPKDMLTTMAELYHPGPMSNPMYSAVLSALNGNEAEVKAFNPSTPEETAMKDAILSAMKDQTKATSAPAQKEPPATPPKPDTIPGFSAAFAEPAAAPALPNFGAEKVKPDNKNASSHNPKVDHIAKLAKAGDVKALLALGYSTNTYGKKQAKLANDALAALGSPHQVTPGQKANAHAALVNGTAQNAPVTASVQPLPKPIEPADKPKPVFKPELISKPPSFTASSVTAVNEANNAAAKEIYNTGKTGDLHALQNLKFEQLDKASQQKTGVLLSFDQHPSKGVQEYYGVVQDEVSSQLSGKPLGPQIGPVEVSKEWSDLSNAVMPVAMGSGVANVPDTQKIGLYIMLGKAPSIPVVNTVNTIMGKSAWGNWAKGEYNKASSKAQSIFDHYIQSSGAGAINNKLRNGDLSGSVNGMKPKEYVDLFNKELAVDIPEGAKFIRMMGTSGYGGKTMTQAQVNDLIGKIEKAGPGTVLQEPGFTSASHGTSILSGNNIQWNFTAGQGVRAFPAWLTANKGEAECLFPPNQRYLVTGYKKVGGKFVIDALLLPTV